MRLRRVALWLAVAALAGGGVVGAAGCGNGGRADAWVPPVEPLPRGQPLDWAEVADPPPPEMSGWELRDASAVALRAAAGGGLGVLAGQERDGTLTRWRLVGGDAWSPAATEIGPGRPFAALPSGETCGVGAAAIPGCATPEGGFERLELVGPARGRDGGAASAWWGVAADRGRFVALLGTEAGARLHVRDGRRLRPVAGPAGEPIADELGATLALREDGRPCAVGAATAATVDGPGRLTDLRIELACPGEPRRSLEAHMRYPDVELAEETRTSPDVQLTSAVLAGGRLVAGVRVDWQSDAGGGPEHSTAWSVLAERRGGALAPVPVGGSIGGGSVTGTLHRAGGRVWAVRIAEPDGTGPRGRVDVLAMDPEGERFEHRGTLAEEVELRAAGDAGSAVATGGGRVWLAATAGGGGQERAGWRLWSAPLPGAG